MFWRKGSGLGLGLQLAAAKTSSGLPTSAITLECSLALVRLLDCRALQYGLAGRVGSVTTPRDAPSRI